MRVCKNMFMHHCVVLSERPKLLNFNVDWENIYVTICISSFFVPHAYILPLYICSTHSLVIYISPQKEAAKQILE